MSPNFCNLYLSKELEISLPAMHLPDQFLGQRRLETLVENQTSYTLDQAALHVFETHQSAEKVFLQFDQPVLASMIVGKKIMHLRDDDPFTFLPGESLILPSNEIMCIDFPEAQMDQPTRCLAMAIADEKINRVIDFMNEGMEKSDQKTWGVLDYNFHFTNDEGIYRILQRLIYLFAENHPSKELFVNNMLEELIVRVMQTNSRHNHLKNAAVNSTNCRLAHVIDFIKKNLHQSFTINQLSAMACMSESNFRKVFKNEMGMSPVDFINTERLQKASQMLKNPQHSIKEVFIECGFENRSYFNRLFKRMHNDSPQAFQDRLNAKVN
ncbi:MAG: AraC family transcriptional regulator [Flavobacteriales bacterium]|nr:AraC family transcriptional regulator [Flavobacteriales bacterium]